MKPIKLTEEDIVKILKDVQNTLTTSAFSTSTININYDLKKLNPVMNTIKPLVIYTPTAYIKAKELVKNNSNEIGWHGIVTRKNNTFIIRDIIVFPQVVTSATVNPDQIKYQEWLMSQPDDIFPNIRMHGHSHVNMPTHPSGTDMAYREAILTMLGKDDFYIFMILNKRDEVEISIYDLATNFIYETADIQIEVMLSKQTTLKSFIKEASAQTTMYSPPSYITPTNYVTPAGYKVYDEDAMTGEAYYNNYRNTGMTVNEYLTREFEKEYAQNKKSKKDKNKVQKGSKT